MEKVDIKKYKREWAILFFAIFIPITIVMWIFLAFNHNTFIIERLGFFIFGLIFILVGVMSIRHKISGGIAMFVGSKAYPTVGLTELFTPKKITTDLRKPYRIGKWTVVEGWVFVFIGVGLFLLAFGNSSRLQKAIYTQACKMRGGDIVDRGPIGGCFLKNEKIGLCNGIKFENGKIEGDCIY